MPVVSDWFTVVVTAFNKSSLTDFIKKVDISSTPVLFLWGILSKNLEMAFSLTSWNEKKLCVTNVDKILNKLIHNGLSLTGYIIIY